MKKLIILLIACLPLSACIKNNDVVALQNRVAALEQRVDSMQPNMADNWAEMQQLQAEMSQLQGRMDELDRRFSAPPPDSLAPSYSDEYPGVTPPPDSNMTPEETIELYGSEPAQVPANEGTPQATDTDPAQTLYNRALQEFRARNYETAQTLWAEFVESNPRHDLTPNAHFWQGECFYQLRDYPQAVLAYQQVIEDYPQSSKYPSALLKQGVSFLAIGKEQAGKAVLQQLIDKFPNSPEAEKAREFLRTN